MTRKMAPVEEQLYVLMSGVDYGDAGLYKTFSAELKNLLDIKLVKEFSNDFRRNIKEL